MLRLELTGVTATLRNFNPRVEKKGNEKSPATDLSISVALAPDCLAFFAPTLKHHLFNVDGPRDLADGLPLRDPHQVYPLKRDEEMTGATLSIEYGVNSPMVFDEARLKDFQITPMEGGTVILQFTAQIHPDPHKDVPNLYLLQEQGITITVEPGELAEMAA